MVGNCFPGYKRTFDFFFLSIIQKEVTLQGAKAGFSGRARQIFFQGRERCVRVWGQCRWLLLLNNSGREAQGTRSLLDY